MKPINAFMVMGSTQLLTVVDTVNLVNQSFTVPADRVPDAGFEYDHLVINCGAASFSHAALEDAARKAIHTVEIHCLKELNDSQTKALFLGFTNALVSIEICYGSSEHYAAVNAFLRRQLLAGRLEKLTLINCFCSLATLEDEVMRFLWRRADIELKVVLDEPTREECLGMEVLNTFVEMTYTHHPETKRRKTAEVYIKAPKKEVEAEVAKRDFARQFLEVRVESVARRLDDICKLSLTYECKR